MNLAPNIMFNSKDIFPGLDSSPCTTHGRINTRSSCLWNGDRPASRAGSSPLSSGHLSEPHPRTVCHLKPASAALIMAFKIYIYMYAYIFLLSWFGGRSEKSKRVKKQRRIGVNTKQQRLSRPWRAQLCSRCGCSRCKHLSGSRFPLVGQAPAPPASSPGHKRAAFAARPPGPPEAGGFFGKGPAPLHRDSPRVAPRSPRVCAALARSFLAPFVLCVSSQEAGGREAREPPGMFLLSLFYFALSLCLLA